MTFCPRRVRCQLGTVSFPDQRHVHPESPSHLSSSRGSLPEDGQGFALNSPLRRGIGHRPPAVVSAGALRRPGTRGHVDSSTTIVAGGSIRTLAAFAVVAAVSVTSPLERVIANDNTISAGTLHNGVLTLGIEARVGEWHPDAESAPGMLIQAFGEPGKSLRIPGPLIRVKAGTEVRVTVINKIPGATLRVHGLVARPVGGTVTDDTLTVDDGAAREVRFRLDAPGTYFYWGSTTAAPFDRRTKMDGQLAGAIVVADPAASGKIRDRVFVISEWADSIKANNAPMEGTLWVPVINGKAWPNTERLTFDQGDTVRWRWVNASYVVHPLHLHGFYYSVDSRGDGLGDTTYALEARRKGVTSRMGVGATMTMTWVAERPGNWLFHCHVPAHIEAHIALDRSSTQPMSEAMYQGQMGMGGLVIGMSIRPRGAPAALSSVAARPIRLVASVDSNGSPTEPAYSYSRRLLVLTRGEPVAVTIVNLLPEATAVHWHGVELESYADGVAGFSGSKGKIAPIIEPQDSFAAKFTPPRAGTFMYHTHIDEVRQEPAGLSGVLLVMEPGAKFDSTHDHPILLTTPRREADRARIQLNGSLDPPPLEWRAGETHRIRLADILVGAQAGVVVKLVKDSTLMQWRSLAKDGLDLPASDMVMRRATVMMTIGETHDFEVRLDEPGDYKLEFRFFAFPTPLRAVMVIRVK